MKIRPDEDNNLVLTEVYNTALITTEEGNQLGFCLRDDTVELLVLPKGATKGDWWRVDMQTGEIYRELDRCTTDQSVGSGAVEPS